MAKPEHHPWAYGPQWNYYPPHALNFPKSAIPSGPKLNPHDARESYPGIRCPEPRRPYQVPCSNFGSYGQQVNHAVGPYLQPSPLYYPKQYIHRPVPHENSTYQYNENFHSYPTCANPYNSTKDESNYCHMPWTGTSHYPKKTPELDVRHFLSTWQEKDDELNEVSPENEGQIKIQVYESTSVPLDCTKRKNREKNNKKTYENFMSGHPPNTTGCVVQPYHVKDSTIPVHRNAFSSELNNNIPERNIFGHDFQYYHTKNYYANSDYYKPLEKFVSCEHNYPYTQQSNSCDINISHIKNNIDCGSQKDIISDNSERSQYNLTSSLESGDLFCDINSRNEDTPKQHNNSAFNDLYNRGVNDVQSNVSHNNQFPENLVYTDLNAIKEAWNMHPPRTKYKEVSVPCKPPIARLPSHSDFESNLIKHNAIHNNSGSIMYEGAFNILPNINDSKISESNPVQYNSNSSDVTDNNSKPQSTNLCLSPNKTPSSINKCNEVDSQIKPYQYSEEISSDDIDISIASSGDLVVEEQSTINPDSVINLSHDRKNKISNSQSESNPECIDVQNNNNVYPESFFYEKTNKVSLIEKEDCDGINLKNEVSENIKHSKNCIEDSDSTFKASVMDLTVFKPQTIDRNPTIEKNQCDDYLDVPSDYFNDNKLVEQSKTENQSNDIDREFILQDDKINVNSLPPYIEDPPSSSHVSPQKPYDEFSSLPCIIENQIQSDSSDTLNMCSEQYENKLDEGLKEENLKEESNIGDTSELDFRDDNQENDLNLLKPPNEIVSSLGGCSFDSFKTTNDNLLLLAHCSQEYGCNPRNVFEGSTICVKEETKTTDDGNEIYVKEEQESTDDGAVLCIKEEAKSSDDATQICVKEEKKISDYSHKNPNLRRDSVIKCSLRWDKIFNITLNDDNVQRDMSLDLGPAKVELRMPSESCTSGQWKIVEVDNKGQTSSIVKVKRLILKRKSPNPERIPKMIIKKTEGQVYRSYLKEESHEGISHCGKIKICFDASSQDTENTGS